MEKSVNNPRILLEASETESRNSVVCVPAISFPARGTGASIRSNSGGTAGDPQRSWLRRRLSGGETPAGLELIDGHMRADVDADQELPVLVLDVTEEEAKKLLATLDPLTGMAIENAEAKRQLLEELDAQDASLKKMLADMLAATPVDDGPGGKADLGGPVEMELRPHEHYDYVIVLARNTQEWNRLVELLDLHTVRRRGRIGAGRGLPAQKLIELLEGARNEAR